MSSKPQPPPAEGAPPPPKAAFPFHARTKEECFTELSLPDGHQSTGLTTADAAARLQKYGPNKLSEKEKVTLLTRIWRQINNVLVFILAIVAIVSFARALTVSQVEEIVANWIQIALIVFVVVFNTIIGLIQEGSAAKAAEALKAMLSSDAVVVRDGKDVKVPADQLVPGDLVRLSLGDRVPADMRLLEISNLATLEAALTGEPVPIDKTVEAITVDGDPNSQPLGDRDNMCFSATLVSSGAGVGLVIATGDNTEIGTINALVNKVEAKKTNVLVQIDKFSSHIAIFVGICALATWFAAFFIAGQKGIDALTTALVCAVAMIPAGLAALVTVVYSWSVAIMAKNNAIIRVLPAVETLGSVTVICSDKTGTLTKNEMTLVCFVTHGKRYRFDVNSKERIASNFRVNDKYLAARADHARFIKASEVIKKGPSASRKSGHGKHSTFPFGITTGFGKTAHGGMDFEEPIPVVTKEGEEITGFEDDGDTDEHPDTPFLRRALGGGILCSKCVLGENGGRKGEIGNPTELSILRAAYFGDVNVSAVKDSAPLVAEVPFSSEYKFMATVHNPVPENDGEFGAGELIVHVKGAPDRMIPLCKYQAKEGKFDKDSLEPIDEKFWIEQIAILSSHGLRVLALTRGSVPTDSVSAGQQLKPEFVSQRGGPWLTIVGLCAIMDPPRPECVAAIKEAHHAGVRVAMITGDHADTALAIGGQLGLVDKQHHDAITGPELDAMNDEELQLAVQRYNVFARASPQNKIKIVNALQADGEVCSMTGDGVNDAPALKAADMGVAMGKEGTDVAREASDMILADDNFATIVLAVREGRVVWDNLRKVLLVNTAINNAQGLSVLLGILLGLKATPLSSIQVLYSNLICAVSLGFVCAVEPAEPGIMDQPPRRVGKKLLGRLLLLRIAVGTIALVASTVGSVFWVRSLGYDDFLKEVKIEDLAFKASHSRSQALNNLNIGAVVVTMSSRFARKSAFHSRSFTGNAAAVYSYILMGVLQAMVTYIPGFNSLIFSMKPMDATQWGICILLTVALFIVLETEKAVRNVLSAMKNDSDLYYDEDDHAPPEKVEPLPAETNNFGRNELAK